MSLRLIFMGTPPFAATALTAIQGTAHEIIGVWTRPPAKAGRGLPEQRSAVHERAVEYGLPVHTPKTLNSDEVQARFATADLAVTAAYGLLLPPKILDAPRLGCWNIHASLLPRWRGAAPVQRAIMAGDTQTGISIMQMDEGLDTGKILLTRTCPIADDDTAQTLLEKLTRLGAEAILAALDEAETLRGTEQPSEGVTYAAKIEKHETRIDWSRSAQEVYNHIRGLSPLAWTEINGARVKILAAEVTEGESACGEVLDERLTVACGTGAVRITRLQKAGKAAMAADDFLRGSKPIKECV